MPQLRQMGNLSLSHRCFKQAATTNFTLVLTPTCSNLLPSTLNFIFLMKCHLLTSGRIIIKRNGHKAVFMPKAPLPACPPPQSWRGGLHSHFMSSAAGISQASTQRQDGTASSFPSLWEEPPSCRSCCCSAGNNWGPRTSKVIVTREAPLPWFCPR